MNEISVNQDSELQITDEIKTECEKLVRYFSAKMQYVAPKCILIAFNSFNSDDIHFNTKKAMLRRLSKRTYVFFGSAKTILLSVDLKEQLELATLQHLRQNKIQLNQLETEILRVVAAAQAICLLLETLKLSPLGVAYNAYGRGAYATQRNAINAAVAELMDKTKESKLCEANANTILKTIWYHKKLLPAFAKFKIANPDLHYLVTS